MEEVKLVPKIRSNKSNLDSQVQSLPPFVEFRVADDAGNDIHCDCSGFMLNHGTNASFLFLY
jgi:hypothetical protein